jgi:hypothetical protein
MRSITTEPATRYRRSQQPGAATLCRMGLRHTSNVPAEAKLNGPAESATLGGMVVQHSFGHASADAQRALHVPSSHCLGLGHDSAIDVRGEAEGTRDAGDERRGQAVAPARRVDRVRRAIRDQRQLLLASSCRFLVSRSLDLQQFRGMARVFRRARTLHFGSATPEERGCDWLEHGWRHSWQRARFL